MICITEFTQLKLVDIGYFRVLLYYSVTYLHFYFVFCEYFWYQKTMGHVILHICTHIPISLTNFEQCIQKVQNGPDEENKMGGPYKINA